MARRPRLLFLLPVSMHTTRDGINELQFSKGCIVGCRGCSSARPSGNAVRGRLRRRRCSSARRPRGGHGRAGGRDRVGPLCRTPWKRSRLGDGRRGSRGFCGARAVLGGYGINRSESGVGSSKNWLAAGTTIGGGDGGRNTSDKPPRRSRKVVNPYTWSVCAKIAKIGRGEREPTQGSNFSARY